MLTGAFPANWMLPHGMFIYTKGSKEDPGNSRLVSQTLVCIRVWSRSSGALQHGTYRTTRSQAQPAWVCERQIPLDQTDLLPWAGNLCGGISERLWILSDWNLVRSLTEFVLTKHATGETVCSRLAWVYSRNRGSRTTAVTIPLVLATREATPQSHRQFWGPHYKKNSEVLVCVQKALELEEGREHKSDGEQETGF